METPVRLYFQGIEARRELRSSVDRHIVQLEGRFGRVTAGRVVLKGPGHHRRGGGRYEINIRLALPNGREVSIARTQHADGRHADINVALGDVFGHARRQLRKQVDHMIGIIKSHVRP